MPAASNPRDRIGGESEHLLQIAAADRQVGRPDAGRADAQPDLPGRGLQRSHLPPAQHLGRAIAGEHACTGHCHLHDRSETGIIRRRGHDDGHDV